MGPCKENMWPCTVTIVEVSIGSNGWLQNIQKQLANHFSWCARWHESGIEGKVDRAFNGHLRGCAAVKVPPYEYWKTYSYLNTYEGACYLLRMDMIPDAEQRDWATMMSALNAFAIWKMNLPRTLVAASTPGTTRTAHSERPFTV